MEEAPVNFKSHAAHWLLAGILVFLLVPLFFVQSPIGFIPCQESKEFSQSTHFAQYLRGFSCNVVTVINSKFDANAPLPPGTPIITSPFWKVAVPILVSLLNAFSVFALGVFGVKLYNNYDLMKGALENG